MKLIVGLGNPGTEYQHTRHNAGFMLAETVAGKAGAGRWSKCFSGLVTDFRWDAEKVVLLKPETYMNLSGRSVRAALDFYDLPIADLLVLVDDIALPTGKIRLRAGGSSGGHNGLASIAESLRGRLDQPTDFARLRIGVGHPGSIPLERYVLSRFSPGEEGDLAAALSRGAEAVNCWIRSGIAAAMNEYNGG
ncbi:MAG: aminoacyl-tRNA hydrolase [Phycisphaerae bacterium]